MTENTIAWDKDADGIVTLTLDDPTGSANVMNEHYKESMHKAVERLVAEKDSITGVVITLSQLHVLYDPDAGQILNAMYLGLGAGLAAPFVGAFLRRQGRQGRKEKD